MRLSLKERRGAVSDAGTVSHWRRSPRSPAPGSEGVQPGPSVSPGISLGGVNYILKTETPENYLASKVQEVGARPRLEAGRRLGAGERMTKGRICITDRCGRII